MASTVETEDRWFLPRISRQPAKSKPPLNVCRKKRRVKKRDYKSASALTPGTSGPSVSGRSTASASSVFPSSTPLDTPSSSKASSRSHSTRLSHPVNEQEVLENLELLDKTDKDDPDGLGFDPVYSEDYDDKKQRVLKGTFKTLLQNYFPDLIKSQKMKALPQLAEDNEEDYDTDLDPDLGLELLADERAKRSKEDGVCAEYKALCRRYKVVPNSYFIRHVMDDEMRIRYRYLSYGDSASLSHEIQNQPSLTKLDLEDNNLGPAGMLCIAEMLKSNAYITEANFSNNNVGVFGARLMKFILTKNVRLVKLNMAGNKFGERGAKYCAMVINVNCTLKELCLSHNSIGDDGATLIGKALANNSGLEKLDLSWNHIGRKGAAGLAKGLKMNSKLCALKLHMNGCHEEGSRAIISALQYNNTLQELDLSANRIGAEGAKTVSKALPYLRLQSLNLAFNPLSAETAEKILKTLLTLEEPPLKKLDVEGVIVEDDFQLLSEELSQRGVTVVYRIPPSSRELSRDLPMETLSHVISFLDDVEMEPEMLFPNPGESDLIMTVQDLFNILGNSGLFRESTRLQKFKQESQRDFPRRFLIRELFMVSNRRRQSMADAFTTAQSVDNLVMTSSAEPLNTGRSSFSAETGSI